MRIRDSAALSLAGLLLVATPSSAQTESFELFVPLGAPVVPAQAARTGSAVVASQPIGLRLERLFDAAGPAGGVILDVEEHRWIARLTRLDVRDRQGFRSWVGTLEDVPHSHVVFTERDGVVSGLIDAVSARYQVRTAGPGSYVLERLEASSLRVELEPLPGIEAPVAHASVGAAPDDGTTIDVLILYTPAARVLAGGESQIQALASQTVSDGNTIFARSGVMPRLRLVGSAELSFTESSSMSADLSSLRSSTAAQALRDAARADLVQLLVNSPDMSACGIGYQLSSLAPSFEAYSISDVTCVAQYTPTHELGHNIGSQHAPEDGAFNGLFAYSYGFKDPARGFRTVMAYNCSGPSCPRIANVSNPSVVHNGGPTGTSSQHNALSIDNAASTVANWRQGGSQSPPPPPANLRTQVSGSLVSAAWDGSPNATSYTLQVGSAPGGANLFNAAIGNVPSIAGHVPPGLYYWRVVASNAAGQSPPSGEAQFAVICVPPGPPQGFVFSVSGNVVSLAWSPPATGDQVTGYLIEAGSGPGLANLYNGPTGSAQTGGVTPAPPGTYYVRLRAQNACGVSSPSNEQIITVP